MVVPICVNDADEVELDEQSRARSDQNLLTEHVTMGGVFYTGRFLASAFGRLFRSYGGVNFHNHLDGEARKNVCIPA